MSGFGIVIRERNASFKAFAFRFKTVPLHKHVGLNLFRVLRQAIEENVTPLSHVVVAPSNFFVKAFLAIDTWSASTTTGASMRPLDEPSLPVRVPVC